MPGSFPSVATHSLHGTRPTKPSPPRCKCVLDYAVHSKCVERTFTHHLVCEGRRITLNCLDGVICLIKFSSLYVFWYEQNASFSYYSVIPFSCCRENLENIIIIVIILLQSTMLILYLFQVKFYELYDLTVR
jgi:hypothetical protein